MLQPTLYFFITASLHQYLKKGFFARFLTVVLTRGWSSSMKILVNFLSTSASETDQKSFFSRLVSYDTEGTPLYKHWEDNEIIFHYAAKVCEETIQRAWFLTLKARIQSTFRDITCGFPAKWRPRKRRNSTLVKCHYQILMRRSW